MFSVSMALKNALISGRRHIIVSPPLRRRSVVRTFEGSGTPTVGAKDDAVLDAINQNIQLLGYVYVFLPAGID